MKHVWLYFSKNDIRIELQQLKDEGKDIVLLEKSFAPYLNMDDEQILKKENQEKIATLFDKAQNLPIEKKYPYNEPSDFNEIIKNTPKRKTKKIPKIGISKAKDLLLGAWLGRCCGCLLGKASEGIHSNRFWQFLSKTNQFPLRNYIKYTINDNKLKDEFSDLTSRSWADNIKYMPVDDDTNYTLTGVLIVEQYGINFSPSDVATFWMSKIPILATCTAERVAYKNFCNLIPPPQSASFRNPYREWIGAQIRADGFAYTAMGNPDLAANFAFRDASISHIKNGIYGEMFIAAMIASAPFADDIEAMIKSGLSYIPENSRLTHTVNSVIEWKKNGYTYEDAVKKIHSLWDEKKGHDWCHTISNAAICTVALLWGEDDFEKSICNAVYPCFDTDCNGATIGSILGIRHGADKIPSKWTKRLNNTLYTSIENYNKVNIDEIAAKTLKIWKTLKKS